MLDKIRANDRGALSEDYTANLGQGFDGSCCKFLALDYEALAARARESSSDDELLEWSFAHGRRPTADDIHVWNEWMRKRGWNDDVSETLVRRKKQSGFESRDEIETMFQYIEADEGVSA